MHEPRPGISHSRNAGVRAAAAELVAFIDDDEEAEPHWLARLLQCQAQFGADVVVGPVYPMFELDRASRDPYWRWYFTADSRQPSGEIAKRGGGTHNCLIRKRDLLHERRAVRSRVRPDGRRGHALFPFRRARGGRVIWCAEAIINEFVPASRSRWTYALRRRLRESQLLVQSFLWSNPPQFATACLAWMAIGLGTDRGVRAFVAGFRVRSTARPR